MSDSSNSITATSVSDYVRVPFGFSFPDLPIYKAQIEAQMVVAQSDYVPKESLESACSPRTFTSSRNRFSGLVGRVTILEIDTGLQSLKHMRSVPRECGIEI